MSKEPESNTTDEGQNNRKLTFADDATITIAGQSTIEEVQLNDIGSAFDLEYKDGEITEAKIYLNRLGVILAQQAAYRYRYSWRHSETDFS